jgi:dihydroorotase-like cyclic amidohydrolase
MNKILTSLLNEQYSLSKPPSFAPPLLFHGQVKDILIQDGIIISIENNISSNDANTIEQKGLHVSLGWMDSFVHFCDPGTEYKETLETGAAAAAAGGFTDVMVIPNTKPAIDSKSPIEYIIQKAKAYRRIFTPLLLSPKIQKEKNWQRCMICMNRGPLHLEMALTLFKMQVCFKSITICKEL